MRRARLAEVQSGVRYVVGANPTFCGNVTVDTFREGDVVMHLPGYPAVPNAYGDVYMVKVDTHSAAFIAIRHLTHNDKEARNG